MHLSNYLRHLTSSQRTAVALHAGTSVQYLYKLAGQHGRASARMAERIEAASRHYEPETGAVVTAIEVLFPPAKVSTPSTEASSHAA